MKKPKPWEWMVCAGIVFLVACVLWPVTACACSKESAKRAVCLSNVKQLALANIMYALDYDDLLPDRDAWMDVIDPYTKNPSIFHDPEIGEEGLHGYSFDSRLSGKKTTDYKKPEDQTMIFDSLNLGRNASDPFISMPKPGRHDGKNSLAFLDGHAKAIRP